MYSFTKETNSRNIEVIKIKDFDSNRTISLNSQVSPQREIEKFIGMLEPNKCYFIIGSGNGTLLHYLNDINLSSKIYIIELFKEINYEEDFKKELEQKHIYFYNQDDLSFININDIIQSALGMKFEILFHPNYEKLSRNLLDPILEKIKKGSLLAELNKNTENIFKFEWLIEPILNLSLSAKGKSLLDLKKHFEGKPFILVASGPSLIDNLDFIRENSDKAYIIASGSAINGLINNGISPDFVTIMDSSIINYTAHFKDTKYTGPIITTGTTNHLILKNHQQELYFTNITLDTITSEVRPELLKVPSVPSVAIYSLMLTHYLDASEVYLIGQDLAFRDGKYYAKGVHEHKLMKNNQDTIEIEGNVGGKVRTSITLYTMLGSIKNAISVIKETNDKIKFYNLSKTGAKIEGIPFKDKNDILLTDIIDKTWIPKNTGKNVIDYTISLEYYNKIKDCKVEVDEIARKINKINSKVVTLKDLEKLLKLVKKLRQNEMLESHILNRISTVTKSINNLFEFGFENNFHTNDERVEMLNRLKHFVEIVQKYLKELIQQNEWNEMFEEGERNE